MQGGGGPLSPYSVGTECIPALNIRTVRYALGGGGLTTAHPLFTVQDPAPVFVNLYFFVKYNI